ncbi:MAG TPA: hypothetical protein VJH22_07575 [Candidatus Nanoarchaeia archaeon]|nr:hypothetical protein [Candidatus Nanoarchaeia archaeon]
MVYVFGLDVPLIEVFAILSLLVLVCVGLILLLLRKQQKVNKTLDEVLVQERAVKEELDLTKMEEDKQLLLMRRLVEELGQLHLISGKSKGEMSSLLNLSREAQQLEPGETAQQALMLQKMIAQISAVDRVVQQGNQKLDFMTQLLSEKNKEEARHDAIDRMREF